jgi:hypothetical protein
MSISLLKISYVKRVILSIAIGLLLIGTGTIAEAAPLAYYMEGGTGAFGTVDLNTGIQSKIGTMQNAGIFANGFGVANGKLYITSNSNNVYGQLWSINTSTGQVTSVGSSGIWYYSLGSTSNGLFAYGGSLGNLYSINPNTGGATLLGRVGTAGIGVLGSVGILSTSIDSASLYGLGAYDGYAAFYPINTSSPVSAPSFNDTNSAINYHTYYSMMVANGTLYSILDIMGSGRNGYGSANTINPATAVATSYGSYLSTGPEFFWLAPYPLSLPSTNRPLYFPHVDTNLPWQTEIAVINTGDQSVTGTLRALSNTGRLVDSKAITIPAHGRRQITVAQEFANPSNIGYIIFDTDSDAVQGYTKFYQAGVYRAAIPAAKEVNTSDIYVSHIDISALWWTGVSLVNTTSARKDLTITFNTGHSATITLNANEHKAFMITDLLPQPLPQGIQSAVIGNASGVIGLELFGSMGGGSQLDGLLITEKTTATIYYPHVVSDNTWWTGIVAYNLLASAVTITITPYSAQGTALTASILSIPGKGKYVGLVSALGLPANTAWFRIDSPSPLVGFELFATWDGQLLGAYAGGGNRCEVGRVPQDRKERLDRDCIRQRGSQRGVRDAHRLQRQRDRGSHPDAYRRRPCQGGQLRGVDLLAEYQQRQLYRLFIGPECRGISAQRLRGRHDARRAPRAWRNRWEHHSGNYDSRFGRHRQQRNDQRGSCAGIDANHDGIVAQSHRVNRYVRW